MSNLRQAAEMALKYFEDAHGLEDEEVAIKEALRQALDLQTAIERGTKVWVDVPGATEWVEELRGNTPDCKTHPNAPHGFDRNASHSADRYVCECEGWEPVDNTYTKLDTKAGVLHKEWVDRLVRIMGTFDLATGHADTMDQALDSLEEELRDVLGHLRARREWVGLSEDEFEKILETHNEAMPFAIYLNIEQVLKEKNT